jgi:hypothetical protein
MHKRAKGLAHLRAGITEATSKTSVLGISCSILSGATKSRPSGGAGVGPLFSANHL